MGAMEGNVSDQEPDFEQIIKVMEPSEEVAYTFEGFDSFVVRATDMMNRVKIIMYANDPEDAEETGRPFKVSFKNIMREKGHHPLELKHGPSDYTWIDPGARLTHGTDNRGLFTVNDKNKEAF